MAFSCYNGVVKPPNTALTELQREIKLNEEYDRELRRIRERRILLANWNSKREKEVKERQRKRNHE